MTAYYNENDKQTCAWLRELIKQDLIAPGDVDERDIRDVRSDELIRYEQIHFFAGIGVWSYALRQAGWPDDRPVLTGSCPCQPFSSAGKKDGTKDKRHLWPEMFRLIAGLPESKRPPTIFGEQVAQKAGQAWFDTVQADLARENYAAGLVVFPACSVGAPHLRQRLYWFADRVADSDSRGRQSSRGRRILERGETAEGTRQTESAVSGVTNPLEHAKRDGRQQGAMCDNDGRERQRPTDQPDDRNKIRHVAGDPEPADGLENTPSKRPDGQSICVQQKQGKDPQIAGRGSTDGVADNHRKGVERKPGNAASKSGAMETRGQGSKSVCKSGNNSPTDGVADGNKKRRHESSQSNERQPPKRTDSVRNIDGAGPTNGYWRAADWIWCRDEKWRPVKPGLEPLVDGSSARMVRLRGYGNAIVAPQAQAFIESYLETE